MSHRFGGQVQEFNPDVASSIMSTAGDHHCIRSAEFSSEKRTRSDRVHGKDLSSQSYSELTVSTVTEALGTHSLRVFNVQISPQMSSGQILLCQEISEKYYKDSHITQQKTGIPYVYRTGKARKTHILSPLLLGLRKLNVLLKCIMMLNSANVYESNGRIS